MSSVSNSVTLSLFDEVKVCLGCKESLLLKDFPDLPSRQTNPFSDFCICCSNSLTDRERRNIRKRKYKAQQREHRMSPTQRILSRRKFEDRRKPLDADLTPTKTCAYCEKEKQRQLFPKASKSPHGDERSIFCDDCNDVLPPAKRGRLSTIYKRHHRIGAGWRSTRQSHLQRSFGISVDDYDQMFDAQGGVCAICSQPERATLKGTLKCLSVDHCHASGQIRALLCTKCNAVIGMMHEKPELLLKAAAYIEKYHHLKDKG